MTLRDLVEGAHYRFPACCVLRFAFARHYWGQALRRGVWELPPNRRAPDDTCGSFVPCRIIHK